MIEGSSVQHARMRAGKFLAKENPVDADIVIGVPDSGLDAATRLCTGKRNPLWYRLC